MDVIKFSTFAFYMQNGSRFVVIVFICQKVGQEGTKYTESYRTNTHNIPRSAYKYK